MRQFSRYLPELAPNPNASRGDYGPVRERALNADGLNTTRAVIDAWPGDKLTPLIALPGLARANGIMRMYYEDEAHRFGLKSFKPVPRQHP